ncbi:pimeloyl-ACP methyl esterase BioG family protein [Helicobacter japonicus]|uniref:DUF452 family protein n=1 Tax=Helicobacter japonicus TaxID=425400 RepID=A0A4U8TQ65_9HELI|nr:pimeloyl-ACP methyl esterase BioG family protein [Helicobacter japonicus]TLE02677.1 DUF452 family protein [Helicobacter japonicus]
MKYVFLHTKAQSKKCILFFGGFGSRAEHFRHLSAECNVIMLYDYRDFALPHTFLRDMEQFSEVVLIAFSMGVSIAPLFVSHLPFVKKIAINGTNIGIDRVFGIHPAIFKKTIAHFDINNFQKALFGELYESICPTQVQIESIPKNDELKEELQSIFDFLLQKNISSKKNVDFLYDSALLSESDAIFPYSAAKNFFISFCPLTHITITHSPHFVFFDFHSWEELCRI